jgi:acetyl esterase
MDTTTKSGSDLGTRWKRRRLDRSRNRHPARTRRDAAITDSSTAGGRLERATVTALGRAPAGVMRLIGGPPATADGASIDPTTAALLRLMARLPSYAELPLDQARAQMDHDAALVGGPTIPMREVRDLRIDTEQAGIPARLYRADARDADRLLVYFHGGGWVVGSVASADPICRFLARHAGVSVLSIGYRLAPECPFPAAPDDALAAFRFAVARAEDWGHDPALIAVGGDSAGGTLAAVLCQDLRSSAETRPAFQLLLYPGTDLSTKHPSFAQFAHGFFLTLEEVDWFIDQYLGQHPATDPRVSPLLAGDMTGLPTAYVAVAGFDVLRDEGEAYARSMAAAGVRVALRRHDRLIHGFANSTGMGHGNREAMLEACGALRMAIGAGTARR